MFTYPLNPPVPSSTIAPPSLDGDYTAVTGPGLESAHDATVQPIRQRSQGEW